MICYKIVLLFTLSKFLYIYLTIVGSRLIFSSNPNISYLACVDSLLWFSGLCPEIKQKGSPYWRCRRNFFKNKNTFSWLFSHTSKLLFRLFRSCWFFFSMECLYLYGHRLRIFEKDCFWKGLPSFPTSYQTKQGFVILCLLYLINLAKILYIFLKNIFLNFSFFSNTTKHSFKIFCVFLRLAKAKLK